MEVNENVFVAQEGQDKIIYDFMEKNGIATNLAGTEYWRDTLLYIMNCKMFKRPSLNEVGKAIAKKNGTSTNNVTRQLRYACFDKNTIEPLMSCEVLLIAWHELKFGEKNWKEKNFKNVKKTRNQII